MGEDVPRRLGKNTPVDRSTSLRSCTGAADVRCVTNAPRSRRPAIRSFSIYSHYSIYLPHSYEVSVDARAALVGNS